MFLSEQNKLYVPNGPPLQHVAAIFNRLIIYQFSWDMKEKKIEQDTLKPVTKVNSKLDKELQEWEVESTKGGGDNL